MTTYRENCTKGCDWYCLNYYFCSCQLSLTIVRTLVMEELMWTMMIMTCLIELKEGCS